MNDPIRELWAQCVVKHTKTPMNWQDVADEFAELIVRECIKQAHSVGDLRGVNDDMIFGADSAAVRISKHFGVKE